MAKNRVYIGIDPGSMGAIAILNSDGSLQKSEIYNAFEISNILSDLKSTNIDSVFICTLEKVHSMPRDGVKQAFKFGENYGFVKGSLVSLGIPFQEVTPQSWKKEFSLLKKDKSESIRTCKELFPGVNLFRSDRCKKESDGLAEAILIAEYGRRHF